MVEHIADMKRLQQECDIVSIRIAKTSGDSVNLSEFKSCMLAALRSLLPTTWDTNHEVAWNWFPGRYSTPFCRPLVRQPNDNDVFEAVGSSQKLKSSPAMVFVSKT